MNFSFTTQTKALMLHHDEQLISATFYNSYTEMPQAKEEVDNFMDQLHEDALTMLEQADVKIDAVRYAENMSHIQLTVDRLFMQPNTLQRVEPTF